MLAINVRRMRLEPLRSHVENLDESLQDKFLAIKLQVERVDPQSSPYFLS